MKDYRAREEKLRIRDDELLPPLRSRRDQPSPPFALIDAGICAMDQQLGGTLLLEASLASDCIVEKP